MEEVTKISCTVFRLKMQKLVKQEKLKRYFTKSLLILSYTGGKCGKTCLVIIVLKKNVFTRVIDIKFLLTQYLNMALRKLRCNVDILDTQFS